MTPPRSRRRLDHPVVGVTEAAWPLLAGALTAVGLVGSVGRYGLVGLMVIYLGAALFTVVMVYAIFVESDMSSVPVVRIGLGAALVLVVLLGVLALFPVAGWLPAAIAAATSPLVTDRLTRPRRERERATASDAGRDSPEQARVDQAFQRIVAGLENDDLKLEDDDEVVRLEVSQQGQFRFLEGLVGIPLTDLFSRFLARQRP